MSDVPPWVTPILTSVILDATMPPALFRSYVRLYTAAWKHAYQRTDPLHFERQLLPLLGVRRSQARQHLRLLRFAKLLDWTSDGAGNYIIRFPPRLSEKTDSVVVDGESIKYFSLIPTQQTASAQADLPARAAAQETPQMPEPCQETLNYLRRAGVWHEVAERIAAQIALNRERGHAYLPDTGDVLGWIAYCFADGQKNRIAQPAAVLAANLKANRRCPQAYRPPRICKECHRVESRCQCAQNAAYHYPPAFLESAITPPSPYTTHLQDRWGICARCHAFPCQCEGA